MSQTVKDLKAECKSKGLPVSNKTKDQLIALLKSHSDPSQGPVKREYLKKMAKKAQTKPPAISKVDATKSADEWMPIVRAWLIQAIQDPEQHRDIGKVLAQAAEIETARVLGECVHQKTTLVVGESYDFTFENGVRAQSKFRAGDWHFETTRRNSAKNAETNSTGHVAYRKEEFDMVAIFTPSATFGITGSTVRCIPTSALINPKKPDQLVTRINAQTRKQYDTDEGTTATLTALFPN
jgi:hypothetical protein